MKKNEQETPIGYFAGESSKNNIISYLENHRILIPDRIAFRWTDSATCHVQDSDVELPYHQITYGKLAEDIARVAQGLLNVGIQPGDRVVVFLPIGVELYTAMFAVQRIGAIAVFLDSWARRSQLGSCANCVSPTAIISFDAALNLIEQIPEFSCLAARISSDKSELAGTTLTELRATTTSAPIHPVASETTALITFTTGSSGVPKGANRTHRFLSAQHIALSEVIPYQSSDIDLPAFPIFCLNNLATGVTTTIPAIDLANPTEHDGSLLVQQIREGNITCATLSPSMFNAVSRYCLAKKVKINSLRRVVTGGAPISLDNIKDFMAVAPETTPLVLYGSTEVEPMAEITGQEMLAQSRDSDVVFQEGVNVGVLHHGLRARFVRITRSPIDFESWEQLEVPNGTVGELVVSGDHVCRDYYNDQEAFKKAKILDGEGTVWHRTGDLGRLDERGNLWIVGRVHNAILRLGSYHFPVQAEILLKRVPGVLQGAYLGLPDVAMQERAVVAVTIDSEYKVESVVESIRDLFNRSSIPVDSMYVLSGLPLDPRHHSKIEYEVLREAILKDKPKDWI